MNITTLPQSVNATTDMEKAFEALVAGATTLAEVMGETDMAKGRADKALKMLAETGAVTFTKGAKPGQPTVWATLEVDETGAEDESLVAEADAAADDAEAPQVATEETAVLVDGEVQIAQVPVAPVAEAPVAELGINAKKRIVAQAILKAAGDLVENWDQDGVTAQEAAELLAKWLQYTPGKDWDTRLGAAPALKA